MFIFYRTEEIVEMFRKLFYYLQSIFRMLFGFKNWPALMPMFIKRTSFGEHVVKLRRPPIRLTVRNAMDVWSVKETFLDAFYTRYGVAPQDGWVMVDIGAGIGDFSIYAAYGRPNAVVYAFEPYSESYQLLIKNLTMNAIDNVVAFQQAVWRRAGQLVIDLSGGEPLQFSSREGISKRDEQDVVTVEGLPLEDIFEEQGIESVDLMKLDCEGAEYEILMETSSDALAKIQRIIMEYHDIDQTHNHLILIPFLEAEGFKVSHHVNVVHADIGYLFAERN